MPELVRLPTGLLRGYVGSIVAYCHEGFAPGRHVGLPSGSVTLVLPLDPLLDLTDPAGHRQQLRSCLGGLHQTAATIHHHGVQRGVQVALHPLALPRLFGLPARAVVGQVLDLGGVLGDSQVIRLLDRLGCAPDLSTRLDIVEESLAGRLARTRGPAVCRQVARAWQLLQTSGGAIRIDAVADGVGWSTRHLTARFTDAVGYGPKAAARLLRFERTVRPVARGERLADVALTCGYADQAHLTREWTRLAGTTPTRWRRDDVLANVQDEPADAQANSPA
jgi:AraC-like DNA-binding protein